MRRRKKRPSTLPKAPDVGGAPVDFSLFHGKRIAVLLRIGGEPRRLRGTATFEHDRLLGNVLRVTPEEGSEAGNAQMLLSESGWEGRIIPDVEFGCEYLFIV